MGYKCASFKEAHMSKLISFFVLIGSASAMASSIECTGANGYLHFRAKVRSETSLGNFEFRGSESVLAEGPSILASNSDSTDDTDKAWWFDFTRNDGWHVTLVVPKGFSKTSPGQSFQVTEITHEDPQVSYILNCNLK